MIGVGLVGYGYWGPNLVRNIAENPDAHLAMVCDLDPGNLVRVNQYYPALSTTSNFEDLLARDDIGAIVIATPPQSHYRMAMQALDAGKHVLVAKPMAMKSSQAQEMIEAAEERKLTLMVDHVYLFTGAVQQIRELLISKSIGEVYYYDSIRINPGFFEHSVDVVWDLAVHDFSILNYIFPQQKPKAISAFGKSHLEGRPANMAYITLEYSENFIAHIHVNWFAPAKVRRTLIGGDHRMISFDDLDPSEPIKVFDRGISQVDHPEDVHDMLTSYRIGDMWSPKIVSSEGLNLEVAHFLECIRTGEEPISSGVTGLEVVKMLEATTKSMKNRGEWVPLSFDEES